MESSTKSDKRLGSVTQRAVLCTIDSLHKENARVDQHFKIPADSTPTATRKTPETALQNFSTGYSAEMALPCAGGAAATHQEKGLLVPKARATASN